MALPHIARPSSGIAMLTMRERTQPALPSFVRIRYQSSNGNGFSEASAGFGRFACSFALSSRPFSTSRIQFFGGSGGRPAWEVAEILADFVPVLQSPPHRLRFGDGSENRWRRRWNPAAPVCAPARQPWSLPLAARKPGEVRFRAGMHVQRLEHGRDAYRWHLPGIHSEPFPGSLICSGISNWCVVRPPQHTLPRSETLTKRLRFSIMSSFVAVLERRDRAALRVSGLPRMLSVCRSNVGLPEDSDCGLFGATRPLQENKKTGEPNQDHTNGRKSRGECFYC